MSEPEKDNVTVKENAPRLVVEIFDEKAESILTEVLTCSICWELPSRKQVRICNKGHHFCGTCHNQMSVCGICRGQLLPTRNFAVEQLVAKLGAVLGATKHELPPGEHPAKLTPGRYKCLHRCPSELPAYQMLPHIRAEHSAHLVDNVRSHPYSERFSFGYDVVFARDERYIWSAHISDMGLFTVEVAFSGANLFGCLRALGDETVTSLFRHQLVVKFRRARSDSFLEFSLTECPVSSYRADVESVRSEGRCLEIKEEVLLEDLALGSNITIFFSVWKKGSDRKRWSPSIVCPPEGRLFLQSDRKTRRNRKRNMRKKKPVVRLLKDAFDCIPVEENSL